MHNIRIELKKLRDTGDYSPNELKEIKERLEYENEVEKEEDKKRKAEEKQRKAEERRARLGKYRDSNERLLHYKLAAHFIEDHPAINVNGTVAIWTGNSYTFNVLEFVTTHIKNYDTMTTKNNRREVYYSIVDNIADYPKFAEVDKYRIAFNNGVLNVSTLEFEYGPHQEYAILNHIPHDYIEDAPEQPEVKQWLMNLADNNEQVYKLLFQLIGYPMLINCNLRTAFMLVGKAQGGKTKFVEYMQYIYGNENYTTFDISEINGRFNRVQICGRLFNYSDDIDAGYIEKPNFLKRLISGLTSMQVEKKGIDGWGLPFYAKIIMSMNEFPRIKMDSDVSAWRSRFNIINFKHKFDKNPKYDEWAKTVLCTEESISWVIKEAATAVNSAIEAGEFCYNDSDEFIKFMETSNPVLTTALEYSEDDWREIYDIKQWYTEQKELFGSKTAFKPFMTMFNSTSDLLEIYESKTTKTASGEPVKKQIKVYRVRKKSNNCCSWQ